MALSASGKSAVNSSTFAHSRRATASSVSHNMRKWPVSSSGPHKEYLGKRQNNRARDFLLQPSHDLHGGEVGVPCLQQVPVCRAMMHRF